MYTNGARAAELNPEATHYTNPYSVPESLEWESPEAAFANPYSTEASHYNPEDEWGAHEAGSFESHYSMESEDELGGHEAAFENPYSTEASLYNPEDEWGESSFENPYSTETED